MPPTTPSRPAKQYALWLLGRREWSSKELANKLAQKNYPAAEIDECLEFCQKHQLQSDVRYANSKVRMRSHVHGNQRILRELKSKGIAPGLAIEAVAGAEDEFERARIAAQRFSGVELTIKLRQKAWRFLMARGFAGDAIKRAISSLDTCHE